MRMIAEGAESRIYAARFAGIDAVVKKRASKPYRIQEIDSAIRMQRTRKEARIIGTASGLGIGCPVLLFVSKYDIVMERLSGRMLNELIESGVKINGRMFSTLGEYAAIMHNNSIAHGDYTPANVMVDGGNPRIIDFGLAEMTNSVEDRALDLLLMKRSINPAQFTEFIRGYSRKCRDHSYILERLASIENRGRYNTRTLLTK